MPALRMPSRPRWVTAVGAVIALVVLPVAAAAHEPFPRVIDLPAGFRPEGIVVAPGGTAYVGSRADGSIWAARLRTGEVTLRSEPDQTEAVGIEHDPATRRLYVAGGASGTFEVVDARSGDLVRRVQVIPAGSGFINDVALSGGTAYLTETRSATLYGVDLATCEVTAYPLGPPFVFAPPGPNGIAALPDGRLVFVQTSTGELFTFDPDTGVTAQVDLGGQRLTNGDGIERDGHRLYVVRNDLDRVAVVDLAPHARSGEVTQVVTDEAFERPTGVDRFRDRLYVVNSVARTPSPTAAYRIVGTPLR